MKAWISKWLLVWELHLKGYYLEALWVRNGEGLSDIPGGWHD